MKKNILITFLTAVSILSLLKLNAGTKKPEPITVMAGVKVIDWPEELEPLILKNGTFTAPMTFEIDHDTLFVGFYHKY